MLTQEELLSHFNQVPIQEIMDQLGHQRLDEYKDTIIYPSPFATGSDPNKILIVDTATNEFYDTVKNLSGKAAGFVLLYFGIGLEELHTAFQSIHLKNGPPTA